MASNITKYIVCGPTRCAGTLVDQTLKSVGMVSHHTHDRNFSLGDDSNTALVMVDRKDVFAAVMSTAICHRTGQTTHYGFSHVEPFELDVGVFQHLCREHLSYRNGYQHQRPWARIDRFWYEESVYEPWCVLKRLGLDHLVPGPIHSTPAPYNYKDIVLNWRDLQDKIPY